MNLDKRFSIPHYDITTDPSLYYRAIKNASQQFRNEIYDVYFGKIFRYNYQEQGIYDGCLKPHEVVYGNVMGVEASDEQVDNLFKIQAEFGVEISLTINQQNVPVEIYYSKNDAVINVFIEWLQGFYDRGLRSCTLANNHMMKTGALQDKFPEMKWKNTVNQQVSSAQQVLDYLYLGYNVIQLDRSMNRNMEELKRIKDVIENYKSKHRETHVRTSLLVMEDCMPFCPFKREHDDVQIYHKIINYWGKLGACNSWRQGTGNAYSQITSDPANLMTPKFSMPRCGINCLWLTADTFKQYADLVDIFKYSGRLSPVTSHEGSDDLKFGWLLWNNGVASFSEIIDNELLPINPWLPVPESFTNAKLVTDANDIKNNLKSLAGNLFMTDEAKKLEHRLKNCRSQCYSCHLCERTFGLQDIDSLIEI